MATSANQYAQHTESLSLLEKNRQLLESFQEKLNGNDEQEYLQTVEKLVQWLSDKRAYYEEARPKVRSPVILDLDAPFHDVLAFYSFRLSKLSR
jgi:hypothetical protein